MTDANEFNALLADITKSHARMVKIGIQAAEERYQGVIRALDKGMQAAALDPEAKIPSYLSAAIHVLLTMRTMTDAYGNDYANAMVKRDLERPKWERDLATGAKDIPVGR